MQRVYAAARHHSSVFTFIGTITIVSVTILSSGIFFYSPESAFATVCGTGSSVTFTDIGNGQCRAYITTGTSLTVPTDWNSSSNTIEVVGGGAGGAASTISTGGGGGGGAGAYSKKNNVTLSAGAAINYNVGAAGSGGSGNGASGGSGGDTYFCNSTSNCASIVGSAVIAGAKGGAGAIGVNGGAGGVSTSGVGDTRLSGGSGGSSGSAIGGGSGGGGAASASGDGKNGANTATGGSGAGGGGSGGGTAGSPNAGAGNGGDGGYNSSGSGAGTGGSSGTPTGSAGSSGGGGGGNYWSASAAAGAGGAGTQWGSYGSGGGGGGGGNTGTASPSAGGAGGNYGGGGGGGGGYTGTANGGAGAKGVIIITYSPSVTFSGPAIGSGLAINGWLWSDTIGWIQANCATTNVCGSNNFGLAINPATGVLSGVAWSDNAGWVTANAVELAGCPSGTCQAAISTTTNKLTGWLKIWSGNSSQSGNWDGYIALDDKNTGDAINYGVTYSSGNFSACDATHSSCAWGDTNVGWVSFAGASSTFNTCSASVVYGCIGTQIIVATTTVTSCQQTTVQTTCVAPQYCSAGTPTCITPPPTPLPGGTGGGTVTLTGNLQIRPNLVSKNGTTTVFWNLANVSNCSVTSTNGSSWTGNTSATSSCATKYTTGCTTNPITDRTTFTLQCTAADSSTYTETATVSVLPNFLEN